LEQREVLQASFEVKKRTTSDRGSLSPEKGPRIGHVQRRHRDNFSKLMSKKVKKKASESFGFLRGFTLRPGRSGSRWREGEAVGSREKEGSWTRAVVWNLRADTFSEKE